MRKTFSIPWRTALIFVLIWFIVASILLDFWPFVRTEGGWKTLTHEQYGFTIDYPSQWVARQYGEHGHKGADEIKLIIHRSWLSFQITLRRKEFSNPTLEDAVAWGDAMSSHLRGGLDEQGDPAYEEMWEDNIQGHPVVRRRYKYRSTMYEDVYIARRNDLIIIRLQSEEHDFYNHLPDFERIVSSLRPLD